MPFRIVPSWCLLTTIIILCAAPVIPLSAQAQVPPVIPNRTVPQEPTNWFGWMKWGVSDEDIFRHKVFVEPLVPTGGKTSASENKALLAALEQFAARAASDDASSIEAFLKRFPQSAWRLSLLVNLGDFYYRTGQFTPAIAKFQEAWDLGKSLPPSSLSLHTFLVDQAVGNLAKMRAKIGEIEKLESLLAEIDGRPMLGSASEAIAGAKEGHWRMVHDPGTSFHCGPLALAAVRRTRQLPPAEMLMAPKTSERGFRLAELDGISKGLGMDYVTVKADRGAVLTEAMLPAVVHWKLDHYAAVLRKEGDKYLIQDQTFGSAPRTWITAKTLASEASGYFLVPAGKLASGWHAVAPDEAAQVRGKGAPQGKDDDETSCEDAKQGGGEGDPGMAAYKFHSLLISLHIFDRPLPYTPTVGPLPLFKVMYNQRDANQPAVFSHSNFGPKWTMNLLAYVQDDPNNVAADVKICRIGGARRYDGFNAGTQSFATQTKGRDVLKRITPISYERLKPDGSKEIYAQPDGASVPGRKIFLTAIVDAQGNTLTLHYDSLKRLTAVTDATGFVSTFTYGNPSRPYLITRITDPFGRFAKFDYNAAGWLIKITDVIGLESSFDYGAGDFIKKLTTPYGSTHFAQGQKGAERWLEATDPLGDKERIEFRNHDVENDNREYPIPNQEAQVPSGIGSPTLTNDYLSERNTFYWDKKAMKMAPGDYSKAVITHWCHLDENLNIVSGIPESTKRPYESRVWFTYPNQNTSNNTNPGLIAQPKTISRVLSDGSTQVSRYTYNDSGKVTNFIDPETRNFTYLYAANGIDLLEVRQTRGSANDLMQSLTYNAKHQPLTVTNAAGQTTTTTYNARGQVKTVTNAKGETTTHTYDSLGNLTQIDGDEPGATTTLRLDSYNRVSTITDSEDYSINFAYDALDRQTSAVYPDGTFTQTVYDRLDAAATRDRDGRWTKNYHNALRQLVAMQDPLGRATNFEWCKCGSLQALIDGKGQATRWKYNEAGQMIEKKYANGSTQAFAYDNANRLTTRTDALGQATTYAYFKDNKLKSRTYTNTINPIENVSFTYDQEYNRIKSMTDGSGTTPSGTTDYTYHPIGGTPVLGAGQLHEINGPLTSDVIALDYDELGRLATRQVNGDAMTYDFYDNLGRLRQITNALGTFGYTYVNHTARPEVITLPNGEKTTLTYWPNASATAGNGDQRLKQIKNQDASANVISQFDYEYDVKGMITKWTKTLGAAPVEMDLEYDEIDRLTQATTPSTQYGYHYDKADNRTVERIDDSVKTATFNNVNQLTQRSGGGLVQFSGTTDEEATVTVANQNAQTWNGGTTFSKDIALPSGTNIVTLTAEDPSGNATTQDYKVAIASGANQTLTYDANGNMTSDGTRTYEWDAENRLIKITDGTKTTDIEYDGLHRWTRIHDKNNNVTVSDRRFIWSGTSLVEQRNGTNTAAVQRYFAQGVQQGANSYYYTRDHLGSIREVMDNSGSVVARYDYDPYGRRTKIAGAFDSDFGFTGHYFHSQSGLHLAPYRAYSAELGRWISRDPIQEKGGLNLYAYVENNPVNLTDREGLASVPPIGPPGTTANPQPEGANDPRVSEQGRQNYQNAMQNQANQAALSMGAIAASVAVTGGAILAPEIAATAMAYPAETATIMTFINNAIQNYGSRPGLLGPIWDLINGGPGNGQGPGPFQPKHDGDCS